MDGAEVEKVSAAGEVRFPRVSREQRDWHAKRAFNLRDEARCRREILDRDMAGVLDREAEQHEALVAAWDAAVPGVVDSSWAEVVDKDEPASLASLAETVSVSQALRRLVDEGVDTEEATDG